jgi:hypothetical protein
MIMWELKDKYKRCCHNNDCDSFDTCIDCWDDWVERNPPMTNADRIRAMSDEELAKVFEEIAFDVYNCNECQTEYMKKIKSRANCGNECDLCILEWLKQPAEGE